MARKKNKQTFDQTKHEDKKREKNKRKRKAWYNNRKVIRQMKRFLTVDKKITPHPLIVINNDMYKHIEQNTIILHNMRRDKVDTKNCTDGGITYYDILSCGKNVKELFITNNDNISSHKSQELNYLAVICKASEKTLIEDPNICYTTKDIKPSDYVLLLLFTSDVEEDHIHMWNNDKDLKCLKRFKKSTVKSMENHHYGSTGQCFSFGLRNSFKTDEKNISITTYAGDNASDMNEYRSYIWRGIASAHKAFDSIIGGISNKLNMTNRSMVYMSYNSQLSDYFANREVKEDYNLSVSVNINATTSTIHCEKDTTYTTIYVPRQVEEIAKITFQFQINEVNFLNIIGNQHVPAWLALAS